MKENTQDKNSQDIANHKDKQANRSENKQIYSSIAPYLNLGLQMAFTIVALVLLGWWLDKRFDTSPIWTLILTFIGIFVAFYNFIRAAIKNK